MAVALYLFLLILRQLREFLLQTSSCPGVPNIHTGDTEEGIHLILVAAHEEFYIFGSAVSIGFPRIQGQVNAVALGQGTYAEYLVETEQRCPRVRYLLGTPFHQIGYGLAAKRFHHLVGDGDSLLRTSRLDGRAAL